MRNNFIQFISYCYCTLNTFYIFHIFYIKYNLLHLLYICIFQYPVLNFTRMQMNVPSPPLSWFSIFSKRSQNKLLQKNLVISTISYSSIPARSSVMPAPSWQDLIRFVPFNPKLCNEIDHLGAYSFNPTSRRIPFNFPLANKPT